LENCDVWKANVARIEYLTTYDKSNIDRTLKYPMSNHVDADFFFKLKRKTVRTLTKTPVDSEPMARLVNLNHSM
jgi:hypothetical protein